MLEALALALVWFVIAVSLVVIALFASGSAIYVAVSIWDWLMWKLKKI